MNKIVQIIVSIIASVLSPIGLAWLALMKKQYDLAKTADSDGGEKITWYEIRGLFLDGWRTIPDALKDALKKIAGR